MVGSNHLKSVNLDIEVDWAMISDNEDEVALMAMKMKKHSDEGFATVGEEEEKEGRGGGGGGEEEEEEEESVDLSEGAWGQYP
jgi:hypothetical protein